MEKVVCALWRGQGEAREAFNARLLSGLPEALCAAGATRIRINVRDASVAAAAGLVQAWQDPQQDAVVQFWLPSANSLFRTGADLALAAHCQRFAAWLVAESTIIANDQHPPTADQRTWGWSQASFISFRQDIAHAAALGHWHSHHTRVAIDTQANFEYIQNAILCPLTEEAPAYDAFVEECFPPDAMTDPAAFFGAVGDPLRLAANTRTMMDSCAAFIDFSRIDIVPTSQFDF
jgi:EthD domain